MQAAHKGRWQALFEAKKLKALSVKSVQPIFRSHPDEATGILGQRPGRLILEPMLGTVDLEGDLSRWCVVDGNQGASHAGQHQQGRTGKAFDHFPEWESHHSWTLAMFGEQHENSVIVTEVQCHPGFLRLRGMIYVLGLDEEASAGSLKCWARGSPHKEKRQPMSKRGLGSLADLAKILEEASNPESAVREDRKENKPKVVATRKTGRAAEIRSIDPKRKAWYQKRLREQAEKTDVVRTEGPAVEPAVKPAMTKAVATRVGVGLLETIAAAKDTKVKSEGKGKVEAWRRKPGDPIF